MHISSDWGVWLGAILTFMVLSYLYKENPAFRLAEHLFVGLASGYGMTSSWDQYLKPAITKEILKDGKFWELLPILVGLLIYLQFFPKLSWLARFPMSWWVGYGSGYVLAFSPAPFIKQITDSFQRFQVVDKSGAMQAGQTINNILFWMFLVGSLCYFVFTINKEKNKAFGYPAWLGRWVIMVGLGAAFGGTVMARISLFIGRLQFLFGDWLGAIKN